MQTDLIKNTTMIRKLSELQTGEWGIIDSFSNNEIFIKLMEMGCVPGEKVSVEIIAPLGDPISIQVAGYNLSLRLNEAEHIFISQSN
jgi:ferrous iron transport protein A